MTPESKLKAQVELYLSESQQNYIPLRMQVGTFFRKGTPTYINGERYYKDSELFPVKTGLPKGTSDLLAIQPVTGRAVWIETKVHPRKPTAEQLNFIEVMRKQGAIAGVVYSIDELKELLNKY